MEIKIKKGTHKSFRLPGFIFKPTLTFFFRFNSTPNYTLDDKVEQKSMNKIYGLSDSWFHQKHSIRIGWRYELVTNTSIAYVYFYRDGKHFIERLGEIVEGVHYLIHIQISKRSYTITGVGTQVTIPRTSKWWGVRYLLFPYFGGKSKAPKDFNIEIVKW